MMFKASKKDTALMAGYILSLCLLAFIGYSIGGYTAQQKNNEKALAAMNPHFASNVAFVDLPRISISLSSGSSSSGRVRIDMTLEVEKKYMSRIADYQPTITDHLISYVRNLSSDQMQTPQAVPMLRKQLLKEVNSGVSPVPVMDIIFRQFLVI